MILLASLIYLTIGNKRIKKFNLNKQSICLIIYLIAKMRILSKNLISSINYLIPERI